MIIPTLNEAETLPLLLASLRAEGMSETLVVDGGSCDGTPDIAREWGVTCLSSARGRAAQLNRGAAAAHGDWLWFLHADTILPADWQKQLRHAMEDPTVVGGGFRVVIDAPGAGYRILDAWGWWRTQIQRSFYGDQGIFVRKEVFKKLGGFMNCAVLEDLDFSTRLRRLGKIAILPDPLKTSARRWEKEGFWPTVWEHSRLAVSYQFGWIRLSTYRRIAVVIMAKAPIPGQVKTRLVPPLTPEQAASLAQKLLQETLGLVQGLNSVHPMVAVAPPQAITQMRQILSEPVDLIPQTDGDFGRRLESIFEELFAQGAKGVILLGADHPDLPSEYLAQAVEALQRGKDHLVLGPTEDGGYYLIGLNRLHPELLQGIPWSSSKVLEATLEKAKGAGLPVKLLPPWYDIDRPEDLERLTERFLPLPLLSRDVPPKAGLP